MSQSDTCPICKKPYAANITISNDRTSETLQSALLRHPDTTFYGFDATAYCYGHDDGRPNRQTRRKKGWWKFA